jgi:hypothetical protein
VSASGLVCPSCGGSFRAGFARCTRCERDLVSPQEYAAAKEAMDDPRQALKGVKTVAIVHASLAACREIEGVLLDHRIRCYVAADDEGPEAQAAAGTKVGVFVAEEDLPKVSLVLKSQFESLVKSEGVGSFKTDAIDLAKDTVECPACGHNGALVAGECADCGLFLGAPA